MIRWYEGFRSSLGTGSSTALRASLDPTTVQVIEEMRVRQQAGAPGAQYMPTSGSAESTTVGHRGAVRGAGIQLFFTAGAQGLAGVDFSDPRVQEQLLAEGVVAYGSEFGESMIRSRVGLSAAREGLEATAPRLVAGRMAARVVPGAGDAVLEVVDMVRDKRDNSAEEVVTRVGRAAAVIGTGAAWAGAAVGTAIGTAFGGPVGFVVGFAVGAAVGWLANRFMPGGREYWESMHRIEEKLDKVEKQIDELARRIEEQQSRRRRSRRP